MGKEHQEVFSSGGIMRYIRFFRENIKISFMSTMIYRVNFLLMLIQSIINTTASVLCIEFIYRAVNQIGTWKKEEMLILICTALIVNQLYRAFILPNHQKFARSVNEGSFDRMLLKPYSIIYQMNFGNVDFSSFISIAAPAIVIINVLTRYNIGVSIIKLIIYVVLVIMACLILSSMMMILFSLAFKYFNVGNVISIYYLVMSMAEKPRDIYSSATIEMPFIYIIPIIPLAGIPAEFLLNKAEVLNVIIMIAVALQFSIFSFFIVKRAIRLYSSASS